MVTIRPFRATDQAAARALIEDGLGEHFGRIDRNANPDLVDIAASYSSGADAFFVAEVDGDVVGTTGLIVPGQVGRLVRVAVARSHRRAGVATALLETRHRLRGARGCCGARRAHSAGMARCDCFLSLARVHAVWPRRDRHPPSPNRWTGRSWQTKVALAHSPSGAPHWLRRSRRRQPVAGWI